MLNCILGYTGAPSWGRWSFPRILAVNGPWPMLPLPYAAAEPHVHSHFVYCTSCGQSILVQCTVSTKNTSQLPLLDTNVRPSCPLCLLPSFLSLFHVYYTNSHSPSIHTSFQYCLTNVSFLTPLPSVVSYITASKRNVPVDMCFNINDV
jgi:hypothetical protein